MNNKTNKNIKTNTMIKRLFAVGRRRVAVFLILTTMLGALISADAFVLQWLIDAVQAQAWPRFAACAALAAIVIAAQALIYWRRQTYTERMAYLMMNRLRERLFAGLSRVPLPRMKDLSADRLFSQLTAQLEQVKSDLIDVLLYGVALVAQVTFAVASILAINPVLGVCALVLCVPMALVPVLSKRRVETARGELVDAQNELNGELGDLLHGMADWRLMRRESQVRSRFASRSRTWLGRARHDAGVQMGVDAITNALSHILIFGIWLIGGLLIMHGGMTVAQVVALYALIGNISVPLFQMSGLVAQYHAGRETLRQLEESIGETHVESRRAASSDTNATPAANAGTPQHDDGTIRYRNVRLHHVGAPFDLDLALTGGYVVVGPSGSGKSSLIRALVGLDDDYDGRITVDGIDMRDAGRAAARQRIGYLSQQSHVFRGTVRENVRLFDESISDATIIDALRRAQLADWADEQGLDRQVDVRSTRCPAGSVSACCWRDCWHKGTNGVRWTNSTPDWMRPPRP